MQEGGLEQAVAAGLGNVPYSEAYKTAQKMQASLQSGKGTGVSAYQVGKMLLESQSEEAVAARTRYKDTMDSAKAVGASEEIATTAATAAARFNRQIEFVSPEQLRIGQTDGQNAIVALDNGKIYVQADRNVLSGNNKEAWKTQIDTFFDNVLEENGSLTVESIEGDTLTITKDDTIWKGKDEHVQIGKKKRNLTKGEYLVKLHAVSHVDELAEASVAQKNPDGSRLTVPDEKNHPFAKDGFNYHTVFFQDYDGKYYRLVLSVGLNDGVATVYNVGQIKETATPEGEIISVIGSKARGATVSDTTVSQNSFGVNTHSMQEGAEYTQNGVAMGQHTADGRILLSSDISDEAALHFVLKHELAHSIEGTAAWDTILKMAKRQMGAKAWEEKVADTARQRQELGDTVGAATPEREVVADWIGENLYSENFAQALARTDRQATGKFVQVMDKLRLALTGSGNRGAATRIATLERMYLRALETEQTAGEGQYAVSQSSAKKKTVERYTEKQYNAFGWASYNDIITTQERETLLSRFADFKHNKDKYPVNRWGEAVIHSTETPDVIIYVKTSSTIELPEITRVVRIATDDFVDVGSIRERIIADEYEQNALPFRTVELLYGEEILIHRSKRDCVSFREYTVGMSGRGSRQSTTFDKILQDGTRSYRGGENGYTANDLTSPSQQNTEATGSSSTVSDTADTEAGFAIPSKGSYSFLPPDLAAANEQARQAETDRREQAAAAADAIHRQAVERAVSGQRSITPSQAQTMEELRQELGDEEFHHRLYIADQFGWLEGTVTVDGREVESKAYARAVEDLLPDDVASLEQFIRDANVRAADEVRQAYEEGTLEPGGWLPVNLQLFAAKCKLDWANISKGEDGKETRQFYEKRLQGMDENHHQELVDMLAGRSETYNPIGNEKTLARAKDKLRNSEWKEKLEKRLYNYRSGQPMLSAMEGAAVQVMINDALNDGEWERADGMIRMYARCGTDLGRAVQIMSLQRKLTPEGTIRAVTKEFQKAADQKMGKHTNESLDSLAGDVTDAISRLKGSRVAGGQTEMTASAEGTAPSPQSGDGVANPLTNEELEDALVRNIRQNGDPYITEKEVRDILHRAIENAGDIPAHLKKMLLKDEKPATDTRWPVF